MATERLNIYTQNQAGKLWPISDIKSLTLDTIENGFYQTSMGLSRPFGVAWEDLALNNFFKAYNSRSDSIWEGRLESIEPAFQNDNDSLNVTALGSWASTKDIPFHGVVSSSATPEAMIATFLNSTYLPQLSTSTAGLLTTNVTGDKYQTGNYGTDDEKVGDIIQAICASGIYSGGVLDPTRRVVPAVWAGRQLITSAVTIVNPSPDYIARRGSVKSAGLRRALSSVYNRVIIRYKDSTGNLARVTVDDTTGQSTLAANYGSGAVSFIRTWVADYTGLGPISTQAATDRANIILSQRKRITTDSRALTITQDYSVYSVAERQEIPLCRVRAGKFIQIPDLFPRPSSSGTGTSAGDASLSTIYYIVQTSYDAIAGKLTITPEQSSNLEDLVA
jgi:hypothetical protein